MLFLYFKSYDEKKDSFKLFPMKITRVRKTFKWHQNWRKKTHCNLMLNNYIFRQALYRTGSAGKIYNMRVYHRAEGYCIYNLQLSNTGNMLFSRGYLFVFFPNIFWNCIFWAVNFLNTLHRTTKLPRLIEIILNLTHIAFFIRWN